MTWLSERRSHLAVGTGIAVALAAGLTLALAGGAVTSDGGKEPPNPITTAAPSVGRSLAGQPARPDETGAVDATVMYMAASQRWIYLTDDEVRSAVAEIATPGAGDRLASEVVEEVRTAREGLGESPGRVWWLVHPLAWRVESYDSGEATVAVWAVTVLSASEVAVPQSAWMTVTVDLDWVGDAWRVDAVRDRPGPTPMTGPRDEPWDSLAFDDALDGFTRLMGEVST